MNTNVGLWIDHRKAIIVVSKGKRAETHLTISSHVEKQLRRTGSSPLKGPFDDHEAPVDDVRKRAYIGRLNIYYDTVIAGLGDPEKILIIGPGEAKTELKKRMQKTPLVKRIDAVQPADKLTTPQIVLRVKTFFAKK